MSSYYSYYHSRCSVTHPVGDHNHRSYFLQNQKPVTRMERSSFSEST
ncbi:MAG: hypothetical protein P8179_20575 [Candidatus Thiodiazotropha sp.]